MKNEKMHGFILYPILLMCVVALFGNPIIDLNDLTQTHFLIEHFVDKGYEIRFKSTQLMTLINRAVVAYNSTADQISMETLQEYDLPHTVLIDYNSGILTQQFDENLRRN